MADPTQENRQLVVETPLGKDALLLASFSGHEEISRLFSYRLEMVSTKDTIPPKDIVGKNVSFSVRRPDDSFRHFNGFVRRFSRGSRVGGLQTYEAEVVPWLWFLTQTADCRIFQDKTVPEIVEQIFKDLGFTDFEKGEIKGSHPKWEYCVQYRETDFNFVSRLMEQEGIFYFFKHEKGKHTLVLADQKGAIKDSPEKEVHFAYSRSSSSRSDDITSWDHQFEFTPGKWAQTDYNFIQHPARSTETPSSLLMTNENTLVKIPGRDKFEIYDYPGEYEVKGDGSADTKLRMEEDDVRHDIVQAASTCKTFNAGFKFKVTGPEWKSEEGTYVITSITHSATEPATYDGGGGVAQDYSNTFTCIPEAVNFRPARTTPKPVIQGSQTAVVVGPRGEEIFTDEHGRVKVQFYWDREGKRDDKTSCFIRCQQTSAGLGWGSMFIPRIGQEVVVSYLEGDPDRPLITGVVYNAEQTPAYKLPDEKTKSYIKTNSTQGGDGYNELRFEDKKDKEQIFIHAQKDIDTRVLNDSRERIIGNRHQIIGFEKDGKKGGDQREMVFQDKHLTIKRNQIEHIGGNFELLVGKGEEDGGNVDIVIGKVKKELIEDNSHLHIKKDLAEKIDGSQSLTVGGSLQAKMGQNFMSEAGQEIHIKAGMTCIIEAGMQLSLKVGGNFIDIGPAGVTIMGTMVNINSGGAAGVGSGSRPTAPEDAKDAAPTEPDQADDSKTGKKSTPF